MPKILSQVLLYVFLSIILVGIISGSVYLYRYNNAKKQNFNTIVQTFNAKTRAQAAVDKLNLLKDTYTAQSQLNDIAVSVYPFFTQALSQADSLSTNRSGTDALRQKINTLLIELQNTISSIHDSGIVNTTLISETNTEITLIQTYLTQLQSLGADVSSIETNINAIASELDSDEAGAGVTDTSGQIDYQPVTQTDIQQQQQVVDSYNPPVASPDTGGNSAGTNSDNSEGDTETNNSGTTLPPFVPDASGTPQLIEGANTY